MTSVPKPTRAPAFETWNVSIAQVVKCVGSSGFPASLAAALRQLSPFQMMNGFNYPLDGRVFDLYNEKVVRNRNLIVDRYLAGAFILDPFYNAIQTDPTPRLVVMHEIAPDDFKKSEYYRLHYVNTNIVDEVGFVLPLANGRVGILSLCRTGKAPAFSADAVKHLRAAAPLVCALASRHWFEASGLSREIKNAVPASKIEHPLLTNRELEIVRLILKGHSNLSVAAVLELSPNTVKVHRRQIYSKLNISSQAELFRLFLA